MAGFASSGGAGLRAPRPSAPRPVGAKLTGVKTPPAPLSGQAIAGNHPNWYGPPQAITGGSFSGGVGLTTGHPQAAPQPTPPKVSGTTTTPPASPLDSTYFNNLAANHFRVTNQINSLTTQGQNSTTNLQDALAQLAYQQPRDQLNVEQAANRRGALYSSVEGQQQGNLLNQYQTKQSGLTRADAQRQGSIASRISALQQGEPIYNGQQYDAAVIRATRAAAANPATGQVPAVAPPAPAPPLATTHGQVSSARKAITAAIAKVNNKEPLITRYGGVIKAAGQHPQAASTLKLVKGRR